MQLPSPPQVSMAFPSTMQQVNVLHLSQQPFFYLPSSSSNDLCIYNTLLQPKTYRYFYPSRMMTSPRYGCGRRRMVTEEVVKLAPPRLTRGKRGHYLSGHGKNIEMKQIWRPTNVKSADSPFAGGGGSSSSLSVSPQNTTVMVKNLPNRFRRDTLMGFLDDCCRKHQLEYDFVYLPMDFRTLNNLGYAFVNFSTAEAALKFKEALHNFKLGNIYRPCVLAKSKKVCEITWARIQGKDALVRHFQNSYFTCKTCDFLPVVHTPPRNGSNRTLQQIVGRLCGQAA